MSLVLTEEQLAIQKTAREFVTAHLPVSHLRELRDRRDADGFSRAAWKEMAALGLCGIALPEAHGGAGLGTAELGLVVEECGRQLAPTPFLSSMVLGAHALLYGGGQKIQEENLPALCRGERFLSLAQEEGTRHSPFQTATRAARRDGGYLLDGRKVFVLDGHVADALIVVARTAGEPSDRDGLTLFLVAARAPGVSITRNHTVDSRNSARVTLQNVEVGDGDVLGEAGRGAELLERLLRLGTVILCAEMLGGMKEAFERTVAYLKLRKQFGVPIGSFQALKHRAAHMFCELELSQSIVLAALRAVDEQAADAARLCSAAKARLSDAFLLVSNEAIQMHGGIGVTDELDIGFYLKRARAAEMTFGDSAYHRDRYARLSGY